MVNAKGLLLHSSSLTAVCRSQKPCLHRLLFFFLFLLFLGFNATLSVHVPSFVTYKAQKPKSDSPKLRRQPPTSLSVISYYLRYCVFPTEPGEEVIIKRIIMGQVSAFSSSSPSLVIVLSLLLILFISEGVSGSTFTFLNRCDFTVWPGILDSAGSPKLETTGFVLPKGSSRGFQAPTGWSGRFWGRTGCNFDGSGHGTCATGDCGSSQVECNGAGASPPATLAEFTLGSGSQDYYDVSLVDGYNLPMMVEGSSKSGACTSTGCVTDLNRRCPNELKVEGGEACKSACEAFGSPEYCCSGAYNTPSTCKPSVYSEIFKSACPRSYSYAYDDATSTFTCNGADYTITFCPSSPSQKSSKDSPRETGTTPDSGSGSGSGSGPESESALASAEGTMLANSWLANLATGASGTARSHPCLTLHSGFVVAIFSLVLPFLVG